jgi:hypothetical protein
VSDLLSGVPTGFRVTTRLPCQDLWLSTIWSINTFRLPTHQVNALLMQPGVCKTTDCPRFGSGVMVRFIKILLTIFCFFCSNPNGLSFSNRFY